MKRTFRTLFSDRRGLALITVVGTLALATILLMAIFSVTQTEYKATQSFAAAQSAKELGDAATAIVQAQIQNGQNRTTGVARKTHATQPGMVRVYDNTGAFTEAYKLYSSSRMKETTETNLNTDVPPFDWDSDPNSARYVDLNEPVVRAPLVVGNGAKPSVYFPIIDPRANYNYLGSQTPGVGEPTTQVEGFKYFKKPQTQGAPADDIHKIALPADVTRDVDLRLPMPVEWIYLLQDGTMGTLNAANLFVSATPGVQATVANPIVGRVAFWTDDESCKINVNTASEPTYSGTPYYFHERDRRWAHFPGASAEYQRYPGHPATVALSAVLFPGYRLDPLRPDTGLDVNKIIEIKEKIYELAPKIEAGGSKSGTRPFGLDAVNTGEDLATLIDTRDSMKERLYASVDEMLFKEGGYNATTGRQPSEAIVNVGGTNRNLFDHDILERSRFFLTANSRAPEFSIHGLPRVAMWPIADETQGPSKRTNYDNLIALCATLKSGATGAAIDNSYIFRRAEAHDSTYDVTGVPAAGLSLPSSLGLQRNTKLLGYVENQMSQLSFPRTSGSASGGTLNNFVEKYGEKNVRQLDVSIFDYIRCINLYDGILAKANDGSSAVNLDLSTAGTLGRNFKTFYSWSTGSAAIPYKTFTNPRATPAAGNSLNAGLSDDERVVPGHGVVTPAQWDRGGITYRGFGRMFTISEVGLQFICTGDGLTTREVPPTLPKDTSRHYPVDMNGLVPPSGGQSAKRLAYDKNPLTNSDAVANSDEYPGYTLPAPLSPVPATGPDYNARWYSNFPPIKMMTNAGKEYPDPIMVSYYGVDDTEAAIDDDGKVLNKKHPSKHLGFNPELWNYTLEENTPLEDGLHGKPAEKRVQAIFQLECFCPSLGWTKFYPEFTIVIKGGFANQIQLNGQSLFNTDQDIPIKSRGNVFEDGGNGVLPLGGSDGVDTLIGGRRARATRNMGSDVDYNDPDGVGDNIHTGLGQFNLVSDFITVKRDDPMEITFPDSPVIIEIWDTHDTGNRARRAIQTLRVKFPTSLTCPTPRLVGADDVTNGNFNTDIDSAGNRYYIRRREAPHWWCYNYNGAFGKRTAKPNPYYVKNGSEDFWLNPPVITDVRSDIAQRTRGRLDNDATERTRPGGYNSRPPGYTQGVSIIPDSTSDVTRTVIPAMGDYRMVAALSDVPETMWRPHPSWADDTLRMVHNYTRHSNDVTGTRVKFNGTVSTNNSTLVNSVPYADTRLPDLPNDINVLRLANAFGDFDTGIGNARDGAYINKPDEGNFYIGNIARGNQTKLYRAGYFYDSWRQTDDWRSGVFMTPNRMVSSPVMFGSLPTAVWPGSGVDGSGANITPTAIAGAPTPETMDKETSYQPWQTLLFRPYVKNVGANGGRPVHPGEKNPQDHYLLDMFFMPVVEPYAISEPLSEAGKINMNYQIMPFSYIRRATAMNAVLKGEFMTAIPNADVTNAKSFKPGASTDWTVPPPFYSEADGKFWHRPIDADKTLAQFDERMNFKDAGLQTNQKGLFRSASQICETYMIPATGLPGSDPLSATYFNLANPSASTRKTRMESFWQAHATTGENIRERPYSNIYSRLTTRTNTFRVHVRAQVIKKARSTAPATFEPAKDAVLSEYRGSTVLERFIDPTDTARLIPDYGASANPLSLPPLDTFYQFRTIETKRFAP